MPSASLEDIRSRLEAETGRTDIFGDSLEHIFSDSYARFGRRMGACAPSWTTGVIPGQGDERFVSAYNLMPSVFFAALMHRTALWLRDYDLADRWNALFDEAIADLQSHRR